MKVIRAILVLCLLLVMAGACFAQDAPYAMQTDNQSAQTKQSVNKQNMPMEMATVRTGPVVRAKLPASADVFIGKKFAMRIAAPAGGKSPKERAQIIARRLNSAFAAGMSWRNMNINNMKGQWTVGIGKRMIATADSRTASAFRISRARLANRWARQAVLAMGGQPMMIASQINPVRMKVAGSKQQLGAMMPAWSTASTKSAPMLNAADGSSMGSANIAGSDNQLSKVGSVAVYKNTVGNATIWSFVPTEQTSMSGSVARVLGVGLTSLPNDTISMSMSGYMMGSGVTQAIEKMGTNWNMSINSTLRQENLGVRGATKVVPIFSSDMQQVIGAAQVVGNRGAVAQVVTVYATKNGENTDFTPSAFAVGKETSCPPAKVENVVISSIIMMQGQPSAQPPAATPSTVQPSTMQQQTQPSTTAPAPEKPESTAPSGDEGTTPVTPDEGGPGSGY